MTYLIVLAVLGFVGYTMYEDRDVLSLPMEDNS